METTTQEPTTQEPIEDVFSPTQPTTEPTQTPPLTDAQIRASVAAGLRDAQPAPAPKQWTPEELDKAFNVWKPTQELVDQIVGGGEGALKALAAMRDGLSNQFQTLLQYSLEVAKKEMLGQVAPAMTFAQEQAAAKDREAFFEEHEDLKPYEKLTQTVFNAMKAEGTRFATTADAFKALADRTRALLPTNGNGTGAGQPSGVRTTTPTQKRPAGLSSGSQAGGGGHSAPAAPFSGAEIWD
jgi:hypothetical protein